MTTRSLALLTILCSFVLLGATLSEPVVVDSVGQRASNNVLNLALATTDRMLIAGRTAAFTVSERAQRRDLNRDGDMEDSIVHVFNALTRKVRNLELSPGPMELPMLLQDRLLAVWASEQTVDLNGDGDTSDVVLHVYDTQRDTLTNLRLAGAPFITIPFIEGRRMAFGVDEAAQGQDLNRDGDTSDQIPHVFDILTGRVQSIGLATSFVAPNTLTLDGRWLAVAVFEGGTVVNDDGTTTENPDLDGNGSNFDTVLHLFDTATGDSRNLRVSLPEDPGFSVGFKVGPGEGLFVRSEGQDASGQILDLNGDGDGDDLVLHRVELASGSVTNTRIALVSGGQDAGFPSLGPLPLSFAFQEGLAVFNVAEADQRQDLNGDGDNNDVVLQALSTRTWRMRSLGVSASFILSDSLPARAVVYMSEQLNGKDLNGDGEVNPFDFVLGLADFSGGTPRVVSTGLAITTLPSNGDDLSIFIIDAFALQIRGSRVSFVVPETRQGNRDLNGDGDTTDTVLHIADLLDLSVRNTGLNGAFAHRSVQAPLFPVSGGRVLVPVSEARQGNLDLNRDGDARDVVLQSLDIRSARSTNTGVPVALEGFRSLTRAIFPLAVRGEDSMTFLVDEDSADLNADGDTADRVLHSIDISSGRVTNLGLASGSRVPPVPDFDDDFNFAGVSNFNGAFSGIPAPRVITEDFPETGDAFVFVVSEADQGNTDLNGDGDADDRVVHAMRLTVSR